MRWRSSASLGPLLKTHGYEVEIAGTGQRALMLAAPTVRRI